MSELQSIDPDEVGPVAGLLQSDPFAGHEPLPGLEHLGRHIRDTSGAPSGSPANFEHLRGKLDESEVVLSDELIAEQVATILAEFGGAV